MPREFLQLARYFQPELHEINGWYFCEKPDGIRCLWDGGISRGVRTTEVPWAGVLHPKTGMIKQGNIKDATGLWSQYGNPIQAPDWFLDLMPKFPCDGYLHCGPDGYETIKSIIVEPDNSESFKQVEFSVLSSPNYSELFRDGLIKNDNTLININGDSIDNWLKKRKVTVVCPPPESILSQSLFAMVDWDGWGDKVYVTPYTILPKKIKKMKKVLDHLTTKLIEKGAKGFFVTDPSKMWKPQRSNNFLMYHFEYDNLGNIYESATKD